MKRVLAWSTSLLLMVSTTAAIAGGGGDSVLQGDYGFTGTGVCNEGASVGLFTFNGTRTFQGDGTGTSHFLVHRLAQGSLGPEMVSEVVDAFTYAVNSDGSWTRTIDSESTKGTIIKGPGVGLTFSVDVQPTSTGFVSDDVENLILGLSIQSVARNATEVTSDSVLETVTRSDGVVTHRACQRSFVLIKPL
jgi:hypothetical protein